MPTSIKFIFGCFVVGALALLGASLAPGSITGHSIDLQSAASSAGNGLLLTASAQADSMIRTAEVEFPADLHSFSFSANAFVRSNAISARLQLEGMTNGLLSLSVRDWLPNGANWVQNGFQEASQVSSIKTNAMAAKMPIVRAVKTDMSRFVDARP